MILTVFQIAVLRLWNNKQELLLALIVPMLFFSIFALIFGKGIGSESPTVNVAVVDDDQTSLSAEIISQLKEQSAIDLRSKTYQTTNTWTSDDLARAIIRDHDADVVVHLPNAMEKKVHQRLQPRIYLLCEGTNPVGQQIVRMVVTQVVARTLATIPADLPPPAVLSTLTSLSNQPTRLPPDEVPLFPTSEFASADSVDFTTNDVFAADKHDPKIAMYAAGIAVMFLLFSATGAGGSLLEEYEAGTLDRLLTSRLKVWQLLAGKWLFITCLGLVQLSVMFAWAQFMFGVDVIGHLDGFFVMAVCTAAATASLALCLAVFCRSRAQLNGVAIVLILAMSALGGSMVPRYIMSEEMQRWGQLTFNAWALDGFKKVFWYELPLQTLGLEVKMLLGMAFLLAAVAYVFADRWAAD